jgi:hypothetical protein
MARDGNSGRGGVKRDRSDIRSLEMRAPTGTLLLTAAIAILGPAAGARAATVTVQTEVDEDTGAKFTSVDFVAGNRERIDTRVTRSGSHYAFISKRGKIEAGAGCRQRGRRRAVCHASRTIQAVGADLSDRNDRFVMALGKAGHIGVQVMGEGGNDVIKGPDFRDPLDGAGGRGGELGLDGGPGNDRITGGNGHDVIRGGTGRDTMDGAGGNDLFEDNDSDGRRPDADTYKGGRGTDSVFYDARTRNLKVDLAKHRGGQSGESDRIVKVEDVVGGEGDDTLVGDGRANKLDGGNGDDTVRGAGGNDTLDGGIADFGGFDRLDGGPGDDRMMSADFGASGNRPEPVTCGSGNDLIFSSDPEDRMAADCELAGLPSQDGGAGTLTVNPTVAGGAATFRLTCTRPAGARCTGAVAVGSASTPFDSGPGTSEVTVHLTPADAATLSSQGSLVARVSVTGDGLAAHWTATLHGS